MLAAPAALAAPAGYSDISADGSVAFFVTTEQLVPGDTDTRRDVYDRSFDPTVDKGLGAYVTREMSTGPTGGNDAFDALFEKASADGSRIFFSTQESLVAADADQAGDLYMRDRANGTTTLVSRGGLSCSPGCGNGPSDSGFAGAAPDGAQAFFVTDERLAAGDTDDSVDIYERELSTGTTTLVSAGSGEVGAFLWGISSDGSKAFFTTTEKLDAADTDAVTDIYARDLPNGPTVLVSQGAASCVPGCGNGGSVPVFRRSSDDGSRVFFATDEPLADADTDTATDVYARDLPAGPTTLVSAGASQSLTANFAAASGDGAHAFFTTTESLVGGDTNNASDVYEWSGGAPSLVTSGSCCGSTFGAATPDALKVVFTTTEKLDAADTDSSDDVYEQLIGGGAPVLASRGVASCAPSCGNGAASAIFNRTSTDGSKVFFTTDEPLSPQDFDADADIYMRDVGASTTILASWPGFCPVQNGCEAIFRSTSTDGAHLFFQTEERLATEDVDSELDVYERADSETRLVSTGNSVILGPATPVLTATNPTSPGTSTTPSILGQSDPSTSIKLYTTPDCSGAPIATGTSLELGGAGIAATVAGGSTTSFRAIATDSNGDTSPCSPPVSYTQQSSTPPPPPPPPPDPGTGSGDGSGAGSGSGGGSQGGGGPGGGRTVVIPQTRITFAPGAKTRARRPVFRFTDITGQEGTIFRCKVDRRAWQACGSPQRLKKLRWGKHTFQVTATNAAGAQEPDVAKHRFKVVR